MKVLFVIPEVDHTGSGKQLELLARNLPRDRFTCRVCVLGKGGARQESLRRAGIPVESLGWRRWLHLGALGRLRCLVREFKPDIVHVWRSAALRAVRMSGTRGARLVLSAPLILSDHRPMLARLDRWLLRQVERVIVNGPAQWERCRREGIPEKKLLVIPPGVEIESPGLVPKDELPDMDRETRCLACVGSLQDREGFRDAVWAFDILRYVADGLHLLLIGDGPDRQRLRRFIRDSRTGDRVHLLGARPDVPAWFGRSETGWLPSRAPGGMNIALEAMAVGRPVVASRLPELAEVILDGQTGYLVPPGDKMALARQTRVLLEDGEHRRQFGEAGRQRVARHFAVADLVHRFADWYENQKEMV